MARPIVYTEQELKWIKKHRELPRRKAHEKFVKKFGRDDVSLTNYASLCKRNGWLTGRTGQYEKGSVPANKGKKMPYNPNSARTQFKKGHKPHNTKHVGHERLHEDGYIYISIAEKNPHTGADTRYVLKHKYLWEQENGPIPEGMCLKSLDGSRQNTDPSNWELIDRSLLPYLNGRHGHNYDELPDEVKPSALTIAKLKHTSNKLKKRDK